MAKGTFLVDVTTEASGEESKVQGQKSSQVKNGEDRRNDSRSTWKNREKKLKFSYSEQREYETIDEEIEQLEKKITDVEMEMQSVASQYEQLAKLAAQKEELEQILANKMERWVYLNDLAEQIAQQS